MERELPLSQILDNHYLIQEPNITKMEGYDSINYKIQSQSTTYVLKIYKNTPETLVWIKAEDAILEKLSKQQINCSKLIKTTEGKFQVSTDNYLYRLLSFIEGKFLSEVQHTTPLLKSFGSFLAKINTHLATIYNPVISARETVWDLKHFQKNWKHIEAINDAKDRNLVRYFCLQFSEHISPIQYKLRQSIIHNDANDWNVLVNNNQVTGIIDFGDMCHTWRINEIAIALTYILMEKANLLDNAIPVLKSYHNIHPLTELELDSLYYLIAARLCTSVLNSAHTKKLKPDSDYITISEKPAWNLLKKMVTINPIQAKNSFRIACGFPALQHQPINTQIAQRHQNTSKALSLSYNNPIQLQGSAFQYMYDVKGNTFLDAYNNIMQVGHCHPKVVKAGQSAMAKLNTNTRYIYDEYLSYTDKLLSKFPKAINKVFLVNSGSAASDLAIRIAKTHTNRKMIVVLEHGYHGNTQNGIDISHYKYQHKGGSGKTNNIIEAQLPKVFGSGFNNEEEACQHYISLLKKQIKEHKGKIAAFIAEPIVGCGGQVPLPKNYLKKVYKLIREQGGVCISDEVQVGFGRLGAYFWGYEMYDVIPDIVVLGKPIGNGHPMAAVVTKEALSNSFNNGMEFFSSFGGNPVSCAIGEAVLNALEEDQLQEQALSVGSFLKEELKKLQTKHWAIADVRGEGLFIGVELLDREGHPNTKIANHFKNELRRKHILISTDGPFDNVLKIKPPLYFNKENANQLLREISGILSK